MAEVTADSSAYAAFTHVAANGELAINSGSFGGSVPDAKYDKASAVSAALTANRIMGEYITTGNYGTEWIVTLPTRYTKVSDNGVVAPFRTLETASTGRACQYVNSDFWSREGAKAADVGIPEQPAFSEITSLCFEVNVIMINAYWNEVSDVVSSQSVITSVFDLYDDGWGLIDLSVNNVTPTVLTAGDASGTITGLPVIGFIAVADTVTGTERGGVFPLRIVVDEQ